MVTNRRQVLALVIAVPTIGFAASSSAAATEAQHRIGLTLLAEKGRPACAHLLQRNSKRLNVNNNTPDAIAQAVAQDFRERRTVMVHGVLISELEAASCLATVMNDSAV